MPSSYQKSPHAWIDDTDAPLYRITYPSSVTNDELRDHNEALLGFYQRATHLLAWVVDASAVSKASPAQRGMIAENLKDIRPYAKKVNVGTAVVITSPLVRGILTAVNWITPPPFPQKVFSQYAAAETWAKERLRIALQSLDPD